MYKPFYFCVDRLTLPCIWSGELVMDYLVLPLLGVVACIQIKMTLPRQQVFCFVWNLMLGKRLRLLLSSLWSG